jgi:hypothetical protein
MISLEINNRKSIEKFERFLKRNACCGAQISVFLHNEEKLLGSIIKHGEIFVPPGVCRESMYDPVVPDCVRFTTSIEELESVRLEGFDNIIANLKTYDVFNMAVESKEVEQKE